MITTCGVLEQQKLQHLYHSIRHRTLEVLNLKSAEETAYISGHLLMQSLPMRYFVHLETSPCCRLTFVISYLPWIRARRRKICYILAFDQLTYMHTKMLQVILFPRSGLQLERLKLSLAYFHVVKRFSNVSKRWDVTLRRLASLTISVSDLTKMLNASCRIWKQIPRNIHQCWLSCLQSSPSDN